VFATDKKSTAHTRVIWSCSWSPDGKYFVTGSREGRVVVWEVGNEIKPFGAPLTLKQAATALDFELVSSDYVIAVGCEDGAVIIYSWQPNGENWTVLQCLDSR